MITKDFKGYVEGLDVTKVPLDRFVYPSKNILCLKGKAYVRPGLLNDGFAASGSTKIMSEYVWKDSKSGEQALRVCGTALQLKKEGQWFTIYSGINADALRVRFATWVDENGTVIKKRLAFVDGSSNLHQWSGAVGVVASYDGATDIATLDSAATTALLRGFDPGDGTAQAVVIVHFAGDGTVSSIESKLHDSTGSANTLHITVAPTQDPVAGDLIIAVPVAYNVPADVLKDDIYSYKNHLVLASLDSVSLYFSHVSTFAVATGWTFTVPAAASRTALTALFLQLDGNYTAMISRKNVLWVSTADKWFKMTKLNEVNAYSQWIEIVDFPQAERKGALPFAVANYKGDMVFISQDKTLQRVSTVEILGTDSLELLSDEVEDLLLRLDMDEVRIYYESRYIWIICPNDSTVLMLDMVGEPSMGIERFWNTPQIVPVTCMSTIDGVRYGHSSTRAETFEMFSGTNDLEVPIEAKIAFGYGSAGEELGYKTHSKIGISGRISPTTKATVDQYFETDGAKAQDTFVIDGETAKTYEMPDDVSWSAVPWASRSWGGADMVVSALKRFFAFSKYDAVSYFEHRPVFTITSRTVEAREVEFQLLSWFIDQVSSKEAIGEDLYIER